MTAVARNERSEIRERSSSLNAAPGFRGACHRAGHFGPDPLAQPRLRSNERKKEIREAERRQTQYFMIRNIRARLALNGARSPVGVPLRRLRKRANTAAQIQNALPGTWRKASVTRLYLSQSSDLRRRPVILPAGR
jgi:hypothetical protein